MGGREYISERLLQKYGKIFEKIAELGLEVIFQKYLCYAQEEVLERFFEQMEQVDFDMLAFHRKLLLGGVSERVSPQDDPVPPELIFEINYHDLREFEEYGLNSLSKGEWAVITLGGGSATRFFSQAGIEGKVKGLFPVTPVANLSFFDVFAGEIAYTAYITKRFPLWIVMVSDATEKDIKSYLSSEPWGIPPSNILVLKQKHLPRLDMDGIPVVSRDGKLIWTGNGHGGIFFLLQDIKEELVSRGIKNFVIHNVDNLLARPLHPGRIGFHIFNDALCTLSCVERRGVDDKVGVVMFLKNRSCFYVMEYSFADPRLFEALKDDKKPLFGLAHINTNLYSLDVVKPEYISKMTPVIYTNKVVEIDGRKVATSTLEFLNQSIVSHLPYHRVFPLLVCEQDFFAPVKNFRGKDSVETARGKYLELMKGRFLGLSSGNARMQDEAHFELAPYIGEQLIKKIFDFDGWEICKGSRFYFGAIFPVGDFPAFRSNFYLGEDAEFFVSADLPFGKDIVSQSVLDAPRVYVGENVRIKAGVKVKIHLENGSTLIIKDRKIFDKNISIRVRKGEKLVL